ncbi:hypothetical protein H2199_008342 [Coniosporium tulheliwenetii]|uniref:Uncharacterized protein n=1 Tax=Coniosporium tulheliwenetii TaxID=3383036 RepID=A0ACC2YL06_9PEZI|nr:hypothetical protein H2199_008342 [Cladosporium sp. JES 115]
MVAVAVPPMDSGKRPAALPPSPVDLSTPHPKANHAIDPNFPPALSLNQIKIMSLWQTELIPTHQILPQPHPRTRLLLGLGLMGYASVALMLSDKAEEALGMVPTERDREELARAMPKIRTVDKEP